MKLTSYSTMTALLSQLQTYILIPHTTNINKGQDSFLNWPNFTDTKKKTCGKLIFVRLMNVQ
jgi:hypothetical protein